MSGARTIRHEMEVNAPIEVVWDAWTKPEVLARWLVADADPLGAPDERVVWRDDAGVERELHVVAADVPRRLALAQHRTGAPADLIEVMLGEREGRTSIRMSHSGFVCEDPENEAETASCGWRLAFEILRASLEKHAGKPRAGIQRGRATGLAVTQLAPWLLTSGGRRMWLPPEAQGDPVLMTTREVLIRWPEVDGLLEAKILPAGPRRTVVALRGHSWSASRAELDKHAESFEKALEKLEMLAAGKR